MATPLLSGTWNESTTTADPSVNTTERPLQSFPIFIAGQYLWYVLPPFILLFGVFGNVMILVIMARMTSSGESTVNVYFTAIATFDLLCLVTLTLGQWLQYLFGFRINATHTVVCKVYTWLYTGGGTISCWCLVCLTVHRAISVVWPHRVNVMCTRRTVLLVLAGVVAVFAAFYSHYMIGFERIYVARENNYRCSVRFDNKAYIYFFEHFFVYIELSVYSLFPFVFLAVSNGVLVWKLTVSAKAAARHLTRGDCEQAQAAREKAANAVTLTVVVVSVSFLALTLPTSIDFSVDYFALSDNRLSARDLAKKVFVNAFCNLLGHTNSAANFYLYCLTGRRFREEFVKVLCGGRSRSRSGERRGASTVVKAEVPKHVTRGP